MMNFLEELGKQQGFKVNPERLTIDQVWNHDVLGTVALEHEISATGLFRRKS